MSKPMPRSGVIGAMLLLSLLLTAPVASASAGSRSSPVISRARHRRSTPTGVIGVTGAPLAELVVSSGNLAFASNPSRNEVEVVNLQTGTLQTPIAVGSQPKGLDLSADGSTLYVADSGSAQVSVVNVATRLETHRITVPPNSFDNDTPFSIAVANNGKAFLSTTFAGSGFGARMIEIDLGTEAVRVRNDFFLGSTTEDTHLAASADRSHIGVVAGDLSSGPVFLYSAATDTFTVEHDLNTFVHTVALNRTGSQLLVGPGSYLLDSDLSLEGTIPGGGLGLAVAPSGTTAYRVQSNVVEALDLVRQRVVATIALPEGVGSAPGAIAVSTDGATLAVLTATGVSLVAVASAVPVADCTSTVTGTPPAPEIAHICGAPLAAVVIDGAGHAFASNPSRNEVEVVDLATGALEAPITVGSQPKGLDLSPDGSTLYVADSGGSQVSVVNVAARHESHRITVPPPPFFNDTPFSIAVANNGKALLSTTFAGSGFGARLLEIDLSTEAVRQRTDFFVGGRTTEATHLAASADHSHIGVVAGDISSGPVFMYTSSTDTFTPERDLNAFVHVVALDHTGAHVLVDPGTYFLDGALNLLGTIPGGGLGVAFAPSGMTAYRVQGSGVEVIDLGRQLVVGTIPLPEAVGNAPGDIAVSPDGATLVVLTASGISVVSTTTTKATTTLTTTASGPGTVGGAVTDSAVLAGGVTPGGSITFRLYGPNDTTNCTGPAVFTSTKPVSGNGAYVSDSFAPASAGTYRWVASYSGDGANKGAGPTLCSDPAEAVVVGPSQPTPCPTITTGTVTGAVAVASGQHRCFDKATVTGAITVSRGGELTVTASTVMGGIASNGARALDLCSNDIGPAVSGTALLVTNTTGPIRIGGPNTGCNGNNIRGAVSVTSNSDGLVFGSNYVHANASIDANQGGPILLTYNLIDTTLACSANSPPPTDAGQPNAAGAKTGQCAGL